MFTKIVALIGSFIATINLGVSKPQETEPAWAQPGYVETEHIETENVQRERYEGEIYIIKDTPVAIADKVTFGNNITSWDNNPNITRWD